jgi:multiple sugar transport system permease protein
MASKKSKIREQGNGIIREFDLNRASVRLGYNTILIVSALIIFASLAPIVWVMLSGFKDIREFTRSTSVLPAEFDLARYLKTWNDLRFYKYYWNSFISVAGSVLSAVFFNGLLGYALSRVKPAGSKVVYALVMWGLLIPATTSIVPLFVNISRIHLNGSFIPLWLCIGANAFYVVLFKNFFDSIPASFIEAAKLDGCSDFGIFRRIAVPLSKAIVMVVVMYAITAAWSDFLLPYLLLNNTGLETVMVRLFQFRNGTANDVAILRSIVFVIIPPILLFLIFQKQITQVTIQSGIKG